MQKYVLRRLTSTFLISIVVWARGKTCSVGRIYTSVLSVILLSSERKAADGSFVRKTRILKLKSLECDINSILVWCKHGGTHRFISILWKFTFLICNALGTYCGTGFSSTRCTDILKSFHPVRGTEQSLIWNFSYP